jgi:hypothetical protein
MTDEYQKRIRGRAKEKSLLKAKEEVCKQAIFI